MGMLRDSFLRGPLTVFRTHAYFGNEKYWIEDISSPISYGEILTQILSCDIADYKRALHHYLRCMEKQEADNIVQAQEALFSEFCKLPLYNRIYTEKQNPYRSMKALYEEEGASEFAALLLKDSFSPRRYCQVLEDLEFIRDRYASFLRQMQSTQNSGKKKGQRKIPLAEQIAKAELRNLLGNMNLEETVDPTAPSVTVQYVLRTTDAGEEIVEKLYFDRLLAFAYIELMRGMQKGFVPKCCLNCGRWFLQTPGMSFAYCDQIAPGETEKTCRDIGAVASFQEKVRSNEVWQIHQRAYKKYYARVLKKNMTKDDFLLWARDAEKLRDEALKQYEVVDDGQRRWIIHKFTQDLNMK